MPSTFTLSLVFGVVLVLTMLFDGSKDEQGRKFLGCLEAGL